MLLIAFFRYVILTKLMASRIITGSPAGFSRVNGVRLSSAETWNFNPSPKEQFYFNRFKIWQEWLS